MTLSQAHSRTSVGEVTVQVTLVNVFAVHVHQTEPYSLLGLFMPGSLCAAVL